MPQLIETQTHSTMNVPLILMATLVGILLAGCASFPNEGKQALAKWVQGSKTPNVGYTIVSSQKATNQKYYRWARDYFSDYQEVWCVVTDNVIMEKGFPDVPIRHFIITKSGLLWQVLLTYVDEDKGGRDDFLGLGCSNW